MIKRHLLLLFVSLAMVINSGCVLTEDYQSPGILKCKVVDEASRPLAVDYVIQKAADKKAVLYEGQTRNGVFVIQDITPGTYTIEVTKIGYQTIRKNFSISSEKELDLKLSMR